MALGFYEVKLFGDALAQAPGRSPRSGAARVLIERLDDETGKIAPLLVGCVSVVSDWCSL